MSVYSNHFIRETPYTLLTLLEGMGVKAYEGVTLDFLNGSSKNLPGIVKNVTACYKCVTSLVSNYENFSLCQYQLSVDVIVQKSSSRFILFLSLMISSRTLCRRMSPLSIFMSFAFQWIHINWELFKQDGWYWYERLCHFHKIKESRKSRNVHSDDTVSHAWSLTSSHLTAGMYSVILGGLVTGTQERFYTFFSKH
jgi:hypothetical protein